MEGWTRKQLIFDHNQNSKYKLEGEHIAISCEKCHKLPYENAKLAESKLAGLSHECSSCHDDIHNGQMNHTCEICHNDHGWKGRNLLFDHNQHSSSKLDNLHATFHATYAICLIRTRLSGTAICLSNVIRAIRISLIL